MIDFSKITKTLDGYDCHYFGTRESYRTKLHCFGVWTSAGVHENNYDDQGRRLVWNSNDMGWEVCGNDSFAIIKPPKIVEVTRWLCFYRDSGCIDDFHVVVAVGMPEPCSSLAFAEKHTFRFEVTND